MATVAGFPRVTPDYLSVGFIGPSGTGSTAATATTRLTDFNIPELCGFKDRTTPFACPTGMGYTCMFNTDVYAVACCSGGECEWKTTCCGYSLDGFASSTSLATKCGKGVSSATCEYNSLSPTNSLCLTHRFESGFTMNVRCTDFPGETESIFFTTAGATTAWPNLPRLTGSNGPPTPTPPAAATATATSAAAPGPSGGAIAGSVVGGTVLGAVLASAVLLGLHLRRRRGKSGEAEPVQPQMERGGDAPGCGYGPRRLDMDGGVAGGMSPPQELSVGPATPAPAYAAQEAEEGHRFGVRHGGK